MRRIFSNSVSSAPDFSKEALKKAYFAHYKLLFYLAYIKLGDQSKARHVVQHVFVKACLKKQVDFSSPYLEVILFKKVHDACKGPFSGIIDFFKRKKRDDDMVDGWDDIDYGNNN